MILVDYSQVAIASISTWTKGSYTDAEFKNIVRHCILSTILSYKKKYSNKFGEIVIACDGKAYWRKTVFPYYKAHRKKDRETSDVNWALVFECMSELREDLKELFPYKVVRVNEAEGDDVIAIITEWAQTRGEGVGLDGTLPVDDIEPILIISSDKDFKQLHKFPTVQQWSPLHKSFLKFTRAEIEDYTHEHIVRGDSGDGIPSVLCEDDFLVNRPEGTRATPVTKKVIEKYKMLTLLTDLERARYERNRMLVSFDYIPSTVRDSIIEEYTNAITKVDRMKILNYLIKHNCKLLIDVIEEF